MNIIGKSVMPERKALYYSPRLRIVRKLFLSELVIIDNQGKHVDFLPDSCALLRKSCAFDNIFFLINLKCSMRVYLRYKGG